MEVIQRFFIKLQGGMPEGHPFLLSNLLQCGIDPQGHSDWAEFFPQASLANINKYQVQEQQYVVEDNTVLGKWVVRNMTEEERSQLPVDPRLQMPGSAPDAFE